MSLSWEAWNQNRKFIILFSFAFWIAFESNQANILVLRCNCRWYFGKIKRTEAESILLRPEIEHGSYLMRDSESRRNDFSLSVRDSDSVKHYRIRQLEDGGFFITRRVTFRTLAELVNHYSLDADGLCVNLVKPCSKVHLYFNCLRYQIWIECWLLFPHTEYYFSFCLVGKTADGWSFIQHARCMGNSQEVAPSAAEDWSRSVWWGVRGSMEQHNTCCDKNIKTRYVCL